MMIFIDCYAKANSIILWLKDGKKNIMLEDSFAPRLYVICRGMNGLSKMLYAKGILSRVVRKNSFYRENVMALEIMPGFLSYHSCIAIINKLTGYTAEIYNADIKLEEYYMFEKGIYPLAKVEVRSEGNKIMSIKAIDSPEDIDYEIPKFCIANLQVLTEDNLFKGLDTKIKSISLNGTIIRGTEKYILEEFKNQFILLDPDIIWSFNSNLALPFLKRKFGAYGIQFSFNRHEEDDFEFRVGRHYFAYSRTFYRTHSIFLKGRLNFDKRSFFAEDTGFYGIIEGARVCRQRIQRTAMRSAGAGITNLLLCESHRNNYLLPYKIGIYERFKTMEELYNCDRGSVIFEPRVGFHDSVAELDFTSLYPSIMDTFNLSPETLYCSCCDKNKVPGLHYHFCTRKRGIVAEVAKKLVERRIMLKAQGTLEAKERAAYLKWLLVTMFGYQAFKNKKIGCIEIHESIQAHARKIIMDSVREAEKMGFQVIHGIIDSLFVKMKGISENDVRQLCMAILEKTRMRICHEGNYRWIVFLPSVLDENRPVPTRYYGVFSDGRIKYRGIEARRRDTPAIIANMQVEMIEALSRAKTEEEFISLFPSVRKILRNYIKSLAYADMKDLIILKTLNKTEYKHDIAQKAIVSQMRSEGYDIHPGQTIAYIISDFSNKNPYKRYVTPGSYKKADPLKYAEMMINATFTLLQPFGVTKAQLNELGKWSIQLRLTDFMEHVLMARQVA